MSPSAVPFAPSPFRPSVAVAGSVEGLARIVADRAIDALAFRLKDEWVSIAHLVVSGGVVNDAVIEAIADNPQKRRVDWDKVHIWWSDERYLPDSHAGRHETHARSAGVARIGAPASHLHPIPPAPAADDERPDLAAEQYTAQLRKFAPHGRPVPVFDLMLLEVGPQGEIAGIYPDATTLAATDAVAAVWDAPKPAHLRVTMTLPTMAAATRVWMLAAGTERAVSVGRALAAVDPEFTEEVEILPAAHVHGVIETVWWLDQKAARAVPSSLRHGIQQHD